MNLDKVSKAILSIGTESVREGIASKIVAVVILLMLAGAWWVIAVLFSAMKRWLGGM